MRTLSTATTRQGLALQVDPTTGVARRKPDGGGPPPRTARALCYRSKWEHTFATYLRGLFTARKIIWWSYETITLRLAPSLRYTPDFAVYDRDERLTVYEVKGWSKNRREGIAKLKMAAVLFPWARFMLVEYRGGRMQCTEIDGGHDDSQGRSHPRHESGGAGRDTPGTLQPAAGEGE